MTVDNHIRLVKKKIRKELSKFEKDMLKQGKKKIYGSSSRIRDMEVMYWTLMDLLPVLNEEELFRLTETGKVLSELCDYWARESDTEQRQMEIAIRQYLEEKDG